MTLVKLKTAPSSSAWNFRGEKNGLIYYSSRNGKLFAKGPDGSWYRVERKESK